MATEPAVGTLAVCSQCGKEIIYVGPYWDHPGEIKPRHPALPVSEAPLQSWLTKLDPREQAQIEHARHYREHFSHAGAPSHGQFLLIAKLAALVEDAVSRFGYTPDGDPPVRVQKVALDQSNVWRDLETGVKVEL